MFASGTVSLLLSPVGRTNPPSFHNAPASVAELKSPFGDPATAAQTGGQLYASYCAACHGPGAQGSGNIPGLAQGPVQRARSGEVFWFITKGSVSGAMPSWASLPEQQRWQLVAYLQTLGSGGNRSIAQAAVPPTPIAAPLPPAPFEDFRLESPGAGHRISLSDLPAPYATVSSGNAPSIVARPPDAWPRAPKGFEVQLYAQGLATPRVIRVAPNGDVFVAESGSGRIRVFRGIAADGTPRQTGVFAAGLNRPYGMVFYPAGPNPRWLYVGDTDSVVRFPYRNGDLEASDTAQHLLNLPHGSGHWTRDLAVSADSKRLFVGVGSASNVDDPDVSPAERDRADILAFDPDGSHEHVYASGIRNPSGLAVEPRSGQLWCAVNERDGLGDNLVPDYITAVRKHGFYGWPWWYMGPHQDPRHPNEHPELRQRVISPDVLLQPHNAPLQIAFYQGAQFPAEFKGDIFASEHGSWNKSVRTGYEVIRVPLHQIGRAEGDYEDFLTGFVLANGQVWGRPVGVATAPDGSLLVSDDGSNSIWRITFVGDSPRAKVSKAIVAGP
jgi:glucose/arabinose dehydrogenase/cytochrome c5